jgi:inner membrane protein
MDNLSHSVTGLAVGELLHRCLPEEANTGNSREDRQDSQRIRRRLLLFTCWAASNFPDLDLVLTPLLPAPLGYLLHHRGHTHTVLYAIPQALLLWAIIGLSWPAARKLLRESATARTGFIAALGGGFALHLLMDFLNSYGIHPFHPFDSRWLYGDMVFILEPFFWVVFGVPMAMMVPSIAWRILLLALLAGAPLYFTSKGYLPWGSLALLVLVGMFIGFLQHRAGARGKHGLVTALCLGLAFIGVQGLASGRAERFVTDLLQHGDPANRVLDVSLTSFPTNPLCWAFVSIQSNPGSGTYTLRRGLLSLAPEHLPVEACPASLRRGSFPPDASPAIAFQSGEQGSLDTLRMLKEGNCHLEAWLRFARAPSIGSTDATDLRFDPDRKDNFTTLDFAAFRVAECPRHVPRWDFPRKDLLETK